MDRIQKGIALRLSRWAHMFFQKKNHFVAVYHSLNIDAAFIEKKFHGLVKLFKIGTTIEHAMQHFRSAPPAEVLNLCDELLKMGILVPVLNNDLDLLQQKRSECILAPGLETMYLIVTDGCNLRCKYCFINNNMPSDYVCSKMTEKTAQGAINMFFANVAKNPPAYNKLIKTIVFYGGEPLLNFNLIKHVVEYTEKKYLKELKELGRSFRFSIITNGTRINREIAKFFGQHANINLAISLDGQQGIHDQKRVYPDGQGSFHSAITGYKLLREIGGRKDIVVSCTVDSHNIQRLPDLIQLHKSYGFPAISLNTLLDTEQKRVGKRYMSEVSRRILDYFVLARENGVYEDRVMRKAMAFINKRIHPFDCQATGAQIVCAPNGRLGVCHEGIGAKNFFFGLVSKKFDFHNNSVVKEWKSRAPLNMPQCWDCPALGICGGGCAYGAWLRNGSIWSVDDRFCVHSLMTLKWLIWDLFKKM